MHEQYSLIACVGVALVNLVLSVSIPAVMNMRENGLSFMNNARAVYGANREMVLTSTLIVLIATYLAVEFKPTIESAVEGNLRKLSSFSVLHSILPPGPSGIKYLARLG